MGKSEGKSMQHRALEVSENLRVKEHPLTQSIQNDLVSTLRTEALAEDTQWGNYQRRIEWEKVLSKDSTELPNQSPKAVR